MENDNRLILEQMSEEQRNKIYKFSQINELYQEVFTVCSRGIYFPYNHIVKDLGWGCAWRAIQTLLSSQDIIISFENLYEKFSEKGSLLEIMKKSGKYKFEIIEQLSGKTWAPAEISCHWAEPFIASIACHYYNLPHHLVLLNGSVNGYAPDSVFDAIITFEQFRNSIKRHISKTSIMIDDGHYALSIIGLNESREDEIEFLFADPHIKSNKLHKQVGVYRKTFDLYGNGLINQQTKIQQEEALYSVYEKLEFSKKCWMICFIDR